MCVCGGGGGIQGKRLKEFQASGLGIGCPLVGGEENSRLPGLGLPAPYDVRHYPGLRGMSSL